MGISLPRPVTHILVLKGIALAAGVSAGPTFEGLRRRSSTSCLRDHTQWTGMLTSSPRSRPEMAVELRPSKTARQRTRASAKLEADLAELEAGAPRPMRTAQRFATAAACARS